MITFRCLQRFSKPLRGRLAVAGLLWLAQSVLAVAEDKVLFRGFVVGSVILDTELTPLHVEAQIRATLVNRASQTIDDLSVEMGSIDGMPGLSAHGVSVTTTAGGDRLLIDFTLHGVFTSDSSISYSGEFQVLPGGSGCFAFPEDIDAGAGVIRGSATLVPAVGGETYLLDFRHEFIGDIQDSCVKSPTEPNPGPPRPVGP